jgi:hypothetical protein
MFRTSTARVPRSARCWKPRPDQRRGRHWDLRALIRYACRPFSPCKESPCVR